MGRLDEIVKAVAAAAPKPKYIRAYHGSPARDLIVASGFDPKRIGSHGGSAEGHGYYFSNDPRLTRHYGDGLEVQIGVDPAMLPDALLPFADQRSYRDQFFDAVAKAPENKWKGEAVSEILRGGGTPQGAYQSLLRAHNAGMGQDMIGRFEAGRRASEALQSHGIPGMQWLDYAQPEAAATNYLLFPGVEDQIRVIRKLKDIP